jgi:hypothetical protein
MLSARELDELGGNIDVVRGVVDSLAPAASYIVFVPAITVKLVLLARVSER